MGFLSMFKGASKDDKKKESDTYQNLNNLFSSTYTEGVDLGKRGKQESGVAGDFYKGIVTGDRTKIAPAVNSAVDMADAKKREQSQMGTARGGGQSSDNQQIDEHTRALISSLMGEQQAASADKLAAMGSGDTNAMMSALGIASGTESNLSNLLHQSNKEKDASAAKMWGSLIGGGIKLATGGLG